MSSGELTCKELVELVTDYLEGTLPSDERQRFDAHLETCGGCRAYLQQMKMTISLVGKLTEEKIPGPQKDELLKVFRDWKRTSSE